MTFVTLIAAAVSIYAQANEQPHQAHMNMPMSTDSAMQQELMQQKLNKCKNGLKCTIKNKITQKKCGKLTALF